MDNIKKLQDVIDICIDGSKGYAKAAEELEDTELRTVFNRLSQQRKLFAEELKADARQLGTEIESNGTTAGFFHRNWLDIKSTFSSNTNEAVIDASLMGEQNASETYDAIISTELPNFINQRLQNQHTLIKGAINQLNSIKTNEI